MIKKSLILLASLLFIVCEQGTKITYKSEEAFELFKKAEEKIDNALIAAALPDLQKAVEIDPEFALAWERLSTVYQNIGQKEKAKDALNKAKELVPKITTYEIHRIAIREASIAEDEKKVFSLIKEMAEKFPYDKRAHHWYGGQLYFRNKHEEALESFKKVITIDAEFAPVYNMLGYTYASLGNYGEALNSLKKYAELLPEHPNPHDSYGEILYTTGKYDEALGEFEKANSLKPNVFFVLEHIGRVYAARRQYKKAMEYYKKALEAAKSDWQKGDVHFELGVIALNEGDYKTTIKEANLCMKFDPERPCPHYTKMEILLRDGKIQLAKNEAKKLNDKIAKYAESLEEDAFYLSVQGRLARATANYDIAIETYKKGLAKANSFEKVDYHCDLAETYFDEGSTELAIAELKKGLEINPNNIRTHLLLGKTFWKSGAKDDAENEFTKVVDLLSEADKNTKDRREAEKYLRKIKRES